MVHGTLTLFELSLEIIRIPEQENDYFFDDSFYSPWSMVRLLYSNFH